MGESPNPSAPEAHPGGLSPGRRQQEPRARWRHPGSCASLSAAFGTPRCARRTDALAAARPRPPQQL